MGIKSTHLGEERKYLTSFTKKVDNKSINYSLCYLTDSDLYELERTESEALFLTEEEMADKLGEMFDEE